MFKYPDVQKMPHAKKNATIRLLLFAVVII